MAFFIVYAAPTSLEVLLIGRVKPVIAPAVYFLSKAVEIALLQGQVISVDTLLWVTDLLPAVVCTSLLGGLIFFAHDDPFPE